MIGKDLYDKIHRDTNTKIRSDISAVEDLREDAIYLKDNVHDIQRQTGPKPVCIGVDGGGTAVEFEPLSVQVVRVSDSFGTDFATEVISPGTTPAQLGAAQFKFDGVPKTPLGEMMNLVHQDRLDILSPMLRTDGDGSSPVRSLGVVFREMTEWAAVLSIVKDQVQQRLEPNGPLSDAIVVFDGPLRSKVMSDSMLAAFFDEVRLHLGRLGSDGGPQVYLAGVGKHSVLLDRLKLAMRLEGTMSDRGPIYVEVPYRMETSSYGHPGYSRRTESVPDSKQPLAGTMFFVKFGPRANDPVWTVDVFDTRPYSVDTVLAGLAEDSFCGYPVPYYPLCLQKAHKNAALYGFDSEIVRDLVTDSIREALSDAGCVVDDILMEDGDISNLRY